jgi:hypothetical protein
MGGAVERSPAIAVARSRDELAALRKEWLELPIDSITAHPDYFAAVLDSTEHVDGPYIVTLRRGGALEALLVCRRERLELSSKIGYQTVWSPRVRSITVVYRGCLGKVDETNAALLLGALREALRSREADVLRFPHLEVGHPLLRAVRAADAGLLARDRFPVTTVCWERSLKGTYEDFLGSLSKSTRSGVVRYQRKLERDFDGRLRVRTFSEPEDFDDFFHDSEAVAERAWQRGLGVGLGSDPGQRLRVRYGLERGWFHGFVLYVDETPVAFCHGERYAGRFRYGIPGYDPAYADYRIGTYVLMKMIEHLCADDEVSVLDFGWGDAEYKRRYGDRQWHEQDATLYAPGLRPAWINLVRTGIMGANAALAAGARSLGRVSWVKKRWRTRLRTRADAAT